MDNIDIKELSDRVNEMYEWYILQNNNIIKIDLPEADIKRTSIRINEKVWNEFNEFVDNHKFYEKHTLMAQALKEYMEKYR